MIEERQRKGLGETWKRQRVGQGRDVEGETEGKRQRGEISPKERWVVTEERKRGKVEGKTEGRYKEGDGGKETGKKRKRVRSRGERGKTEDERSRGRHREGDRGERHRVDTLGRD